MSREQSPNWEGRLSPQEALCAVLLELEKLRRSPRPTERWFVEKVADRMNCLIQVLPAWSKEYPGYQDLKNVAVTVGRVSEELLDATSRSPGASEVHLHVVRELEVAVDNAVAGDGSELACLFEAVGAGMVRDDLLEPLADLKERFLQDYGIEAAGKRNRPVQAGGDSGDGLTVLIEVFGGDGRSTAEGLGRGRSL
jgi:hypothetical protein